jgi:TonB family protein
VLVAVPLSLLVHGGIVGLIVLSSLVNPSPPRPPKKQPPRPVSIRRLDARAWAQNRAVTPFKPVERPEERPKGQVVDVAPGNDQRPVESKYLAETNNRVERETKAKNQVNKYSRATATTSANPEAMPAAKGAAAPKTEKPPESGINLTESMLGRRRDSLLSPSLTTSGERETDEPQPVGTESGTQRAAAGGMTEGGGAPNDALDAPEGDGTFLNTREWKHAGFFNRVKQAVSAKWDPHSRLRGRGGVNFMHKVTVVVVTLRPDGSIADLFVAQSSGIDALDAEAMNAFTKAQPFANPPAALIVDGYIRFQFGFQITNETMNPLRMFRP